MATPLSERVEELIDCMVVEEKLAQLGAVNFADLIVGGRFDEDAALELISHGIGQVTRIGAMTGLRPEESAKLFNRIQRLVVQRTRLGIPVIVHEESLAGYCARDATVFPQAHALACTWDPELVQEVAGTIRRQMLSVGARHSLAPVLDVARDPRWGRLEETYGEDPVLVGTLGAAYVRGLQTNDLNHGVLATGKHFLAHGLSEGGRNCGPVQIGPRELREVYAEPFAAAIREAGLATVMSSYSCIDGLPGSGSAHILTELLRDELGFDGMVVADYFAVTLLHSFHRVAADRSEAAAKAITAGLDLELPVLDCYGAPLKAIVASGKLPMSVVDQAVRRVLTAKMRLGLFESPYIDTAGVRAAFHNPDNAVLARRAAARAVVLLANDGVLPLTPGLSAIAVIGPAADDRRLLQGDYHYPAHQDFLEEASSHQDEVTFLSGGEGAFKPGPYFTDHITPLGGLRSAVGPGTTVMYERGCEIAGDDRRGLQAAVEAARVADVAVVVVGGRSGLDRASTVGEGRDASDLRLTGLQEELVREVAGTGTPTVLVVMSGRAHVLTGVAACASAVLVAWPLGEQGGNGLADVLTGRADPCGRLAVTLPRATGQVPLYYSYRSGGAQNVSNGDYTDCAHTPLFCFGHGLSYTTFDYSDFQIEASSTTSPISVGVTVSNAGTRPGEEVVQLYASDLTASVARPERSLIGFARAALTPGQRTRVSFEVHPSRLAFYAEDMRFVVEPGKFRFCVGSSAADIRHEAVVELTGETAPYAQRAVIAVHSHLSQANGARPTH